MSEITLESLAARVAVLEKQLAVQTPRKKDWRLTIGTQTDDDLTREVNSMIAATREAEREAARRGDSLDEPMIVEIP